MLKLGRYLLLCMGFVFALGPMTSFATVVENFTAIVSGDDPFTGNNYFGSFSYDETVLTGVGLEELNPVFGAVTVDFTFEGQAFDETNDFEFNAFPTLDIIDGRPNFIDYILTEDSNGVDFNDPTVVEVDIVDILVPDGAGGFNVDALVTVIPVPAAMWLFGSGLLGLIGIARRKSA